MFLKLFFSVFCIMLLTIQAQGQTGAWQILTSSGTPTARHECSYVQAGNKFYLLGGRGTKPVQSYDPVANAWFTEASNSLGLHHFQAVEYNGKIYVVGAFTGNCCHETPVDNIYIFDPAAKQWLTGPQIPASRRRGAAGCVVYNNKIYVVCGIVDGHSSGWVPWLDVFDPQTNTWTPLPDAPRARDHFHAAVVNGKIYAIGGRRSGFNGSIFNYTTAEVDVYNIATNTWSTLPSSLNIPTQRAACATAVLGDEILVIGGEIGSSTTALNKTEAFNVVTQTWRTLAPLNQGRHATSAVVYNNQVYIACGAGNRGGSNELTSQERFSFSSPPPPSSPPTVAITSPANGASFAAPANITINANATDSDGSIARVEFYQGTTLLNTDFSTPYSYAWMNVPAGNYSLTAKAYDNQNLSATSAAVNISVTSGTSGCVPNEVVSFTLVKAGTAGDIGPLAEGMTINLATIGSFSIRANTCNNQPVGSVKFILNGTTVKTESAAPYAINGDNNGSYIAWNPTTGAKTLTATPYTQSGGGGTPGVSETVNFTIINQSGGTTDCNGVPGGTAFLDDCGVCSGGNTGHVPNSDKDACGVCFGDGSSCSGSCQPLEVVSFTLVKAGTAGDIGPLTSGMTINLATIGPFSIRANTCNNQPVGSVKFILNGTTVKTESIAPYAINGDNNGSYIAWTTTTGSKTLTATPYSQSGGGGTAGISETVTFTVINQSAKTDLSEAPAAEDATFKIYPNPGCGQFTVEMAVSGTEMVHIRIYNQLGQTIYSDKKLQQAGEFKEQLVLNQPAGIYFLQLAHGNRIFNEKIIIRH